MWFDKEPEHWDIAPEDERIRKLTIPGGKIDMVLDTDTYNEVDDQFALSYALLSPDRLNVQAVYAAPFFNDRSTDAGDGMEKSHAEIQRLLRIFKKPTDNFVFRGSRTFLHDSKTPVDSPAARDLIAKALSRSDENPLYVVAIGAITNIASAILLQPEITGKIVVIWLGGHPTSYPTAREFNLSQDVYAARVILNSGVPLILVPCHGVASHLLTSVPEMETCLKGKNALCDALFELFASYSDDHFAWNKEIWDVSAIAMLINPEWLPTKLVHTPMLTDDSYWAFDERRHMMREAYFCERNPIMKDLFSKLANMEDEIKG